MGGYVSGFGSTEAVVVFPCCCSVVAFFWFSSSLRFWWWCLSQSQTLFLGTDLSVAQLSVVTCDAYLKVDLCIYDPYCGWDAKVGQCVHAVKGRR